MVTQTQRQEFFFLLLIILEMVAFRIRPFKKGHIIVIVIIYGGQKICCDTQSSHIFQAKLR